MTRVIEIRTYKLAAGSGSAFHRAVADEAMPMLERWGVEVVAFGPSVDDDDLYYLVRAYASLAEKQRSQDAFYGSTPPTRKSCVRATSCSRAWASRDA